MQILQIYCHCDRYMIQIKPYLSLGASCLIKIIAKEGSVYQYLYHCFRINSSLFICYSFELLMIHNFKLVNLHDRCQISKIAFTGHQNAIASVAHDYFLRVTDLSTLRTVQELNLVRSYLTSLVADERSFTVGTGYGELLTIDPKSLQIVANSRIHTDSITDILQQGNHIVTVGFDGLIKFTDKRMQSIFKTIDINTPIAQVTKSNGKYYTAGVSSFKIDGETVASFGRYNRLLDVKDKLYGTNDEKGFTCITDKQMRYVPCENMVEYKTGILGTSWQTVSFFWENKQSSISCLSVLAQDFVEGDSINSLLVKQNMVFGGGESGNLYMFELDTTSLWLEQ